MAYPNQSGATPQNIKPNEEVKSKSMRSGKPPTSEGFSGAAASHQQLDENASENTPNLHSALQGGGGDQSSDDVDSPTKAQGAANDDMYYDN